MLRKMVLCVAVVAATLVTGSSSAEAGNCYRSPGYGYGGGYYRNSYRSSHYYGHRGPPAYSRSYYSGPSYYYGGHRAYYGGYPRSYGRSGVSFSIGF